MSMQKKRWLAWALALLTTAAVFACVLRFADMRYYASDDHIIQYIFNGYGSGRAGSFCLFIHWLLAYPLKWLGTLDPTRPWFAYMQLALLYAALSACYAGVMHICIREKKPLWAGYVLGGVFVCCVGIKYTALPTYTTTAAMLGAAAVISILKVDPQRQSGLGVFGSMLHALGFAVLGYALRSMTAPVTLAYCGVAFLYIYARYYCRQRSLKPLAASAAAVAVVMGLLVLSRQAEIALKGLGDVVAWQQARVDLMDYYDLRDIPAQVLSDAGWTPASASLIYGYFFLPPSMTTASMTMIAQEMAALNTAPLWQRMCGAAANMAAHMAQNPLDYGLMLTAAIAAAFVAAGGQRRMHWPAVAGTLLVLAALLLYLGLKGRINLHGVITVFFPAAAMMYGLLPAALPGGRRGRALLLAVLVALGAHGAVCARYLIPAVRHTAQEWFARHVVNLQAYALQHPDDFFLYDRSVCASEIALFQTYETRDHLPQNIAFAGTWHMRSDELAAQFSAFGMDVNNLQAQDLLRSNVYFVTAEGLPASLVQWTSEELGVETELVHVKDVASVQLYQLRIAQ